MGKVIILCLPLLTGCASVQFAADLARTNPRGVALMTNTTDKANNAESGELEWYEIVLNIL